MLNDAEHVISVGKKLLTMYVTPITLLHALPSVLIKARDLSNGSAVTAAQIILRRTNAFETEDIKIGSESLDSSDGSKTDVSTIEIPVIRNGNNPGSNPWY